MDNAQRDDRLNAAPVEDDQLPARAWLLRNGFYLVLFAVLLVLWYRWVGLDGMWYWIKALVGLGLVIFIHELGHFAVAKWCDVHVQTFSIGFGPALPGCSFKYGETSYKLALIPLGGYVKMVGEGDSDPESENDPRSFKNKSVGQRMAIISAGVIMNVILAFICFILVFSHGKERQPAAVGAVDTGGKAFAKGVPTGAEFIQIGSRHAEPGWPLYFDILSTKVALSSRGQEVLFVWTLPPSDVEYRAEIEPRKTKYDLRPVVGLAAPDSLELATADMVPKLWPSPVYPNSPAAAARLASAFRPGDRILAVTDPGDPQKLRPLASAVTVGSASRPQDLFELAQLWQRLAGKEMTARVERQADGNVTVEEIDVPPGRFEFGDTIIATTDPDAPARVTPLPEDPRYPDSGRGSIIEFHKRQDRLAGQLMTYRVRRKDGTEADLLVPPAYHRVLGARMQVGPVANLREKSAGAEAGIQLGDVLTRVELTKAGANQVFLLAPPKKGGAGEKPGTEQLVDPVRLPYELRQWAEDHKPGVKAKLTVLRSTRGDPQVHEEWKEKELPEVNWDYAWRFDRERPMGLQSPLAVPELGIAYAIKTTVDDVTGPPASAEDGLKTGDVIKEIRFRQPGKKLGESEEGSWEKLREPDTWAHIFYGIQLSDFPELGFKVERDREVKEVPPLTARPDETWPLAERGLRLQPERVIQRADNLVEAVHMGLDDTWNGIINVYAFLRGILMQRLSLENVGGPITIGRLAERFARMDFYEFLFFLGMISINLAAFNFLPIPVLDGGHMVFLVYEKLRGKPASEQVQWSATLVGLVLLFGLMIGVLILDVLKLI